MLVKNNLPKPPRPDVCDSCFLEGRLAWDDDSGEWLCPSCIDLIREERKFSDYTDSKKHSDYNDNW